MNLEELSKTIKYLEIYTKRKVDEIFAGNYKSSFRGQGLEVSDLRKYEDGDDIRYIDWMTTAKQGQAFVKKFQETRELTTMLLVDISSSMNFTTAKKLKSRIALEISSYFLFSALKNNDKFGAILFSDKIYAYIPPKKGRSHLLRILREIIKGFNVQKKGKTNLKKALDFFNLTVKKSSICFLLSDNISDLYDIGKAGLRSLKIANKKHDFVYLNIFDQFERKINDKYPVLQVNDPETGDNEIIDFSNPVFIKKYNQIRRDKEKLEKSIVKENNIDFLQISTASNIYKELLLFFKKRSLKY